MAFLQRSGGEDEMYLSQMHAHKTATHHRHGMRGLGGDFSQYESAELSVSMQATDHAASPHSGDSNYLPSPSGSDWSVQGGRASPLASSSPASGGGGRDPGELSPDSARKLRSRDRPQTASPRKRYDRTAAQAPPSPAVVLQSGAPTSAWRAAKAYEIVLQAALEELVLDELADGVVEELQNNKWSRERMGGWLRHGGQTEVSRPALATMIEECDRKEAALLRTMDDLVPRMWKGGLFGSRGRKAEFV